MKGLISPSQRTINILQNALLLGFDFDEVHPLEDIRIDAESFLIENAPHKQRYAEVTNNGMSQNMIYSDGFGFTIEYDGEIINASTYINALPNQRHIHTTIVDSNGGVIDLFENLNLTL